jgi:BirA family transcriptional regulator, biotin operon repressor / biotin---[acetyl-CoA-carboxylase] ligase
MSQDRDGQQARFPDLRLMRVARTASTQEVVLRAAREGAGDGFACLAAEQTAGRGRQGRAWVAPAGSSMLASVLVRRSPAVAAGIPFAAGLALVDVLASDYGVTAGLKWPNDVLIGGRKLAGILCEVEPATSTSELVAVALGIGVNLTVNSFPDDIAAVSLHTLVPTPPEAESLLAGWARALAIRIEVLEQGGIAALLGDWRRCAVGLGGPVTVHASNATTHGIAVDVGDDGALLVESAGRVHRFLAAEVHLGSDTTEPAEAK